MSEEYVKSKFESFIKESKRLKFIFGIVWEDNAYYDWKNRVWTFLSEVLGEAIANDFFGAGEGAENTTQEHTMTSRRLLMIFEMYQFQMNTIKEGNSPVSALQLEDSSQKNIGMVTNKKDETLDSSIKNEEKSSANIFIVHGHDSETKETVARFVEKLGFRVIILHEMPNRGKTIIEKFESFAARADFTIILLTPDDIGASVLKKNEPKYRARQNVIFEFGFFAAKVGRSKVCALVKGEVEIPSDYSGVIYIPLDISGAWKISLVKEMRNAGLLIDSDKLLG